jgi:hypothetical protein
MNKIILVTSPDDVSVDAVRILLVGLDKSQQDIVSTALQELEDIPNIVVYVWKDNDLDWLFDKKPKSNLVIFNAELDKQELVGYFAAQSNAYYMGNLLSLDKINNRPIYDFEQCLNIIKEKVIAHEKKSQ